MAHLPHTSPCYICKGTGKVRIFWWLPKGDCITCQGRGWFWQGVDNTPTEG